MLVVSVLVEDAFYIVRRHTSVGFLANLHHGCQTACAHTAQTRKRKFTVGCRFAYFYSQHFFELIEHLLGAAHIAGRTGTHRDGMLAARYHREERIKRYHTINFSQRHLELVAHHLLHLGRQVSKFALHPVKHVYKIAWIIVERIAYLDDLCDVLFLQFYFY